MAHWIRLDILTFKKGYLWHLWKWLIRYKNTFRYSNNLMKISVVQKISLRKLPEFLNWRMKFFAALIMSKYHWKFQKKSWRLCSCKSRPLDRYYFPYINVKHQTSITNENFSKIKSNIFFILNKPRFLKHNKESWKFRLLLLYCKNHFYLLFIIYRNFLRVLECLNLSMDMLKSIRKSRRNTYHRHNIR